MYVIGNAYFWKLLESCNPSTLDSYAEAVRSVLARVTRRDFTLEHQDNATHERVRRWSQGCFTGRHELQMKFPRVLYVCRADSSGRNECWILDVFFTRIPNVKAIYSNRSTEHMIDLSVERELSTQLVESDLADVFLRAADDTLVGTPAGIYLHQKLQTLRSLKLYSQTSKYLPPGSDLKELFKIVAGVLQETGPRPQVIEIMNKRRKEFLDNADQQIIAVLGKEELESLLRSAEISARKWLSAGKQSLWRS
jgi:hypothetical protein